MEKAITNLIEILNLSEERIFYLAHDAADFLKQKNKKPSTSLIVEQAILFAQQDNPCCFRE